MKPFDSAWQLLKYDEDVYGDPEEYNDMFYEGDGSPRDPRKNPAYDDEDLMLDEMDNTILGHEIKEMQRTLRPHDGVEPVYTPEEIEEKERREKVEQSVADFLQSQKLASQPMDLAWRMLKQSPVSPGERKLLRDIRKPKLTRVAPTQMAADPHSHVQPDNMKDIPGTMNEMGIAQANQFNTAMANRPEAKLELQRHMDEIKRRKEEEEAALSEPFVPVHQQNQ
jgi:hypothetical protein